MSKHLLLSVIGILWTVLVNAYSYNIYSPNKKIQLLVDCSENIDYTVLYEGDTILLPSTISMTIDGGECLGLNPKVKTTKLRQVSNTIETLIYKKKNIDNSYNEFQVSFRQDYSIIFRVYDDGIAYRFVTDKTKELIVYKEQCEYNFKDNYKAWIQYANRWGDGDKYYSTFENDYVNKTLSDISSDTLIVLPIVVEAGDKKVAILEADLEDYPGMFLTKGNKNFSLVGDFAGVPKETSISGDKFVSEDNLEAVVQEGMRHDYIAITSGKRKYPWRGIVITEKDVELLNNDMVYRLASPSRIKDMSWIKPGKVAWDWWIECDLWNVDFKCGVNYRTYCEYIDFASENGLEYIIIDVGFSQIDNIMKPNPDIQLEKLVEYAKNKGIGIIVWAGWLAIKDQIEEACKKYSSMGIKGFKIDYMNRDDQEVVNFYYDLARIAAKYHLVLDFHGAYKPTGLQRTYPNVLSFEGVKGQEWCRWTNPNQPRHAVTVPFVRMLAGPMDFTPGVFRSESKEVFKPSWIGSMGQGTRAHQMAMYVVFESYLQMLSDSPSRYRENQECTDFIAQIPTVWDETFPLDGRIGEFVVTARKTGKSWYIGALTNWNARDIVVDFSFLPEGEYAIEYFIDGVNADKIAKDYKRGYEYIHSSEMRKFRMASGGGLVVKVTNK